MSRGEELRAASGTMGTEVSKESEGERQSHASSNTARPTNVFLREESTENFPRTSHSVETNAGPEPPRSPRSMRKRQHSPDRRLTLFVQERDEYDRYSHSRRRPISPVRDHYSQLRRRPISPPPIRRGTEDRPHALRDVHEHRRSTGVARQHSLPQSPDRTRHLETHRSPVDAQSSPHEARSYVRQRSTSDSRERNRASASFFGSGQPTDGQLFRNLSWRKDDNRKSSAAHQSSGHGEQETSPPPHAERIDFNGLKGVPTGPKKATAKHLGDPLVIASASARSRPHIFIAASDCSTMPTSHKHLAKLLRVEKSNVCCEPNVGWRIVFEDSLIGRAELESCYRKFNRQKLFSRWVLNMRCCPDGIGTGVDEADTTASQLATSNAPASLPAIPKPDDQQSVTVIAKAKASPFGGSTTVPGLSDDATPPNRYEPVRAHPSLTDANCTMTVASVSSLRSSPAIIRNDKEDTSSISAKTSSDKSGSRVPLCHVCKKPSLSALEPLALCQSCPRRYHRRCHPKHPVPQDLPSQRTWRCQRCLRKQIPLGSRLSAASLAASSPGSADDLPHNEDRDETNKHGESVADRAGVATSSVAEPKGQQDGTIPLADPSTTLSDADLLVESMFAQETRQPRKTGPLNLVRKKIGLSKPPCGSNQSQEDWGNATTFSNDGEARGEKRKVGDTDSAPRKKVLSGKNAEEITTTNTASKRRDVFANESEDGEQRIKSIKDLGNDADTDRSILRDSHKAGLIDQRPSTAVQQQNGMAGRSHGRVAQSRRDVMEGDLQIPERMETTKTDVPSLSSSTSSSSSSPDREVSANGYETRGPKRISGPAGKRRKLPTRPCAKCQRTIVLNPSGSNMYCVSCQKEHDGSAAPHTSDAAGTYSRDQALNHVATPPPQPSNQAGQAKSNNDDNEVLEWLQNSAESKDKGSESVVTEDAIAPPQPGKLKSVTQWTACETCRVNHKRCTHGSKPELANKEAPDDSEFEPEVYAVQRTPKKRLPPQSKRKTKTPADQSDDLSSAPDDGDLSKEETIPRPKGASGIRRRVFRTVAKDDYDLGNSEERPKNTYIKLVAMALCDTPGHRMHCKQVMQWIAKNIPGYALGEGNWEAGIDATMSQYRWKAPAEKQICKQPFWYRLPADPSDKTKGTVVELMQGVDQIMPHWDPVLKMPRSPIKVDKSPEKKATKKQPSHKKKPGADSAERPSGSFAGLKKRKEDVLSKRTSLADEEVGDVEMDERAGVEESDGEEAQMCTSNTQPSSDDEPLSLQRQRTRVFGNQGGLQAIARGTSATASAPTDGNDLNEIVDAAPDDLDELALSPARPPAAQPESAKERLPSTEATIGASRSPLRTRTRPDAFRTSPPLSLAERIKHDAENADYSALSLFDEWPEYNPAAKPFDKASKLAEIKARPRRKQRFGMAPADPLAEWRQPQAFDGAYNSRHSSISFDQRSARSPNKTQRAIDPWQIDNIEASVKVCDTWEEFFDLPVNPIPIIHDGQLAYRDGLQNDDGTLRRAKVIYKTGYA